MKILMIAAAVCGLALVAAGAAAGHGAGADLTSLDHQARLTTALLFGFVHALAALTPPALRLKGVVGLIAGWAFLAGVVLFSGVLAARLLTTSNGASPFDPAVMLVPVGGVAFMLGWGLLGIAALRHSAEATPLA